MVQIEQTVIKYKKTNFIVFRPKNKPIEGNPNIQIDDCNIATVDSSKFLGIIINSSLDWNEHIMLINQKVNKTIGILKYIKNKLPSHILRSLFFH